MDATGNIYSYTRTETAKRFAERLDGCGQALVLTVSTRALKPPAREALEKSFQALGYRLEDCPFALVEGLDSKELFALVEGLDPLCLVATDAEAATLCQQAVRQEFPPMRAVRLFGREARAFPRLNKQLETEADRQAVWRLLKSLPRGN